MNVHSFITNFVIISGFDHSSSKHHILLENLTFLFIEKMLVIRGKNSNLRNSCSVPPPVMLCEALSKCFKHLGFPHHSAGILPLVRQLKQSAKQHSKGSEKSQQGLPLLVPDAFFSAYVQEFLGQRMCWSQAGFHPAASAVVLCRFPVGRARHTAASREVQLTLVWVAHGSVSM